MSQLHMFKEAGYKLDSFIPESVKSRTAAYMMKSFDIFNSFNAIYRLATEEESEDDITLSKATTTIRHHESFKLLPKLKQREFTAQYIKEFMLKNKFFKKYIKEDYHTKQTYLCGWKLIIEDEE